MIRFKSYKQHELSLDQAIFFDAYNKAGESIEEGSHDIEVERIYFAETIDMSDFCFDSIGNYSEIE